MIAGCALLGAGLVKWGADLTSSLRRLHAARAATTQPWREAGGPAAPSPGEGWDYHPPADEAGARPADPATDPKDADATKRISRRKS